MADAARDLTVENLSIEVGALLFDALAAGPTGAGHCVGATQTGDCVQATQAGLPLVLLLHGFPQSSYQWRHQLPALGAAGFRAVAPDQRGYSAGARPESVSAYHLDELVADVVGIADALGAAGFHVVGHDWGGIVAWCVAARHPDRALSVAAVSTPHPLAFAEALGSASGDQAFRSGYVRFLQQPEIPESLMLANEGAGLRALFANTGYTDRAAMELYVQRLLEPGALTCALNWYRALDAGSLTGVGSVSVPTLYVWSTDDPALGREAAEATAAYVDAPYRFEVLEGVGHWIPEEAAGTLTRLLIEHLAAATSG